MHAATDNKEREDMNFKESRGVCEGLEGEKGRRK